MRLIWVKLHRWLGLTTAFFLMVAGLTGAIISWDHELDEWLNPNLFNLQHQTDPADYQSSLKLADKLEQQQPQLQVTYLPLNVEAGHTLIVSVGANLNPVTGKAYSLDYNQVALDPETGEIVDKRLWGSPSLSRENLLPFLYKLHYSLFIPEIGGINTGIWLMGIIGIAWTLDCFIALLISFPSRKSWRKSFRYRWKQGGHKLTFDLHRSSGVWLWAILLVIAVTSVSMNLKHQVMRPLVSLFSDLQQDAFEMKTPTATNRPIVPKLDRRQIIRLAQLKAQQKGWQQTVGAIFYAANYGIYGVGFFKPGHEHGDGGLGNIWLYFDADSGKLLQAKLPGQGSWGDIFLQAQFPLHSGRILGLPGRIIISVTGLLIGLLSLTGIIIWWRKTGGSRRDSDRLSVKRKIAKT